MALATESQVSIAKKYPREISSFKSRLASLATLDEETAASCLYCLKRGSKEIRGPSARFAELAAYAYKNIVTGARRVGVNAKDVIYQGVAHDLENNVSFSVEVSRRITDKDGKRYNDDMVTTTGNAAASIALRNAILKAIPKAYWQPVFEQARQTAIGDASTLTDKRSKFFDRFQQMGADQKRVLKLLGRAKLEDVTLDDLEILAGIGTSIKDGETTVDQAFPLEPEAKQPLFKSNESASNNQAPKGS